MIVDFGFVNTEAGHRHTGTWMQHWTRFGYATRGVIFTLIGLLSLKVALGWGGATQGSQGAMQEIGRQPFGRLLLILTTVGLAGYVVWRFTQAIFDPGFESSGAQRFLRRAAFAISGLIYALLAFTAAQLALGAKTWTERTRQEWTAWLLSFPLGDWVVGFIGAAITGAGLHALYRGSTAQFMQLYQAEKMNQMQQRLVRYVGTIGLSALGLTLLLIGGLLIQGARQLDASKATDIGGALHVLAIQEHGPYLLGAAALGFISYGLHCFALGWFREVDAA